MTSRWWRAAALGAVMAAAFMGACRELSDPFGGVLAVSRVVLPSPGLVVGDSMRDSLGAVTPLRVIAFDENGDTISPPPTATFILFDTTAILIGGDTLVGRHTGTVRIIGTVAGLQTELGRATVTLRPDTIVAADSVRHRRSVNVLSGDTSFTSAELGVTVQNREGSSPAGVDAVIVTYTLTKQPEGSGTGPVVVFAGGGTAPARDTTANGGRAGRAVRLRLAAIPSLPDSALVEATASYRGAILGTVQFTIVFQTQTP